jgi:hypothetical protein
MDQILPMQKRVQPACRVGTAPALANLLSDHGVVPLLTWMGLFGVSNLNAAALCVSHGDLLNSGWLIAVVDKAGPSTSA